MPNPVKVSVISSRSIKLHWTITYAVEHEIIEGFFVGYRSFDSAGNANEPAIKSTNLAAEQQLPTFTYKTIRLTNQRQQQLEQPLVLDSNQANPLHQNLNQDSSSAFLSPISSVTKNELVSSFQQQQQLIVMNNFEYIINGLERNTEYSILIQCFNKKGAGPTSDPVLFKTFVNG